MEVPHNPFALISLVETWSHRAVARQTGKQNYLLDSNILSWKLNHIYFQEERDNEYLKATSSCCHLGPHASLFRPSGHRMSFWGSVYGKEQMFVSCKIPENTLHVSLAQAGSCSRPVIIYCGGVWATAMVSAGWLEHMSALSWMEGGAGSPSYIPETLKDPLGNRKGHWYRVFLHSKLLHSLLFIFFFPLGLTIPRLLTP